MYRKVLVILALSCVNGISQTRDDSMNVMRLEASGRARPSKALDEQLRAVTEMSDPPQGIYLPFKRKSNGAKPELTEKARMHIMGTALKHPFGGVAGGSGGNIPFVVGMTEPKAYVGVQAAAAKQLMKPFSFQSLAPSSRLPLLRVVVNPQTPNWGVNGGHHVLNVVLADESQSILIQPAIIQPFGVDVKSVSAIPVGGDMIAFMQENNRYGGMNAVFTLDDLERVRSKSPDRSFYLIIIGSDKAKQVYKIDPSYFEQLGD